jgi:hypothetical protein
MANARKKTSSKPVNKSAWIRSQPEKLAAKDVVKKAKTKGIKLSVAQVYTARSTAKKTSTPKRGPHKAPKPAAAAVSGMQDLRHEFIAIAVRLGTDEAQRLLDRLVDVQTPMP